MIYALKDLKIKILILSFSLFFFSSNKSSAQDLSNLTIGNIDFDNPTTLTPDSIPSNLPVLSATFIELPSSVMATNSNSILSGSKAAFSVSAENILEPSRLFDNSITLIDSLGTSFTISTDISDSLINFPNEPNTNFLFNTDIIPAQASEGNGTIVLKSNGASVGTVNVFILKSDVLGTDSNDPRTPKLKYFKIRKHGDRVRLIIRGKNFRNINETTFTTIPTTNIRKLSIKSNRKGKSRIIVTFDLNNREQSKLLFSINTPFGQLLEKVKLRDPAFRKKK